MPYLTELVKLSNHRQPVGNAVDLPKGQAYSSFYPAWETQTPSYVSPNAYQVTQSSYRTNEFVYSLILKRAMAVSQCQLRVLDSTSETPEEIPDHGIRQLLKQCNELLPESYFWGISEISRCIAGFAAWEVETDNTGNPIKLWWMRPDWCSFMREQQKPLAYIRYQPYGLQPLDISMDNILFLYQQENFDPLFPFIKWVSPAMLALPQINVDTGMTRFLDDFIKRGARFGGLISVAQVLTENSAKEIQDRWVEKHGGSENWSVPLVLGQGADYKPMQMNFDEMAFPQLDARTETRICSAFSISPIVADARAGLDVSSYNNKAQATKDWYNDWVLPTLTAYQDSFGSQMLPRYHDDPEKYQCKFHTDELYALQEDKVIARAFWLNAYAQKAVTKNEMREKLDMDPVEGGDEFPADAPVLPPGMAGLLGADGKGAEDPNAGDVTDEAKKEDTTTNENETMQEDKDKAAPVAEEKKLVEKKSAEVEEEELNFHKFATKRIKENKYNDVLEFEFKYAPPERQKELIQEIQAGAVLKMLRDAIKGGTGSGNFDHEGRPGLVGGSGEGEGGNGVPKNEGDNSDFESRIAAIRNDTELSPSQQTAMVHPILAEKYGVSAQTTNEQLLSRHKTIHEMVPAELEKNREEFEVLIREMSKRELFKDSGMGRKYRQLGENQKLARGARGGKS